MLRRFLWNRRKPWQRWRVYPDSKIDTRAVPEVKDWSGAKRGMFYRPMKQQLTLRLDADVVAWFKDHAPKGAGYQTDINRALREHVKRQARKA
ncbi:MAG: BrnA antitoxin family protein [Rhizomicrobium sp.]